MPVTIILIISNFMERLFSFPNTLDMSVMSFLYYELKEFYALNDNIKTFCSLEDLRLFLFAN